MPWDWNFVGELIIGLSLGIGIGGAVGSHFLEVAFLRVAAHPSVRKLANAADKFSGDSGGGWPGLIGKVLSFFTGGKFLGGGSLMGGGADLGPGEALVMDQSGNVIGKTRYR